MTSFRSPILKICVLLSGVVFSLLLMEAVLAVARINTKSNTRFLPGLGSTFIPHAYYRYTKEGFSEGYFNSHGFRDYERTYAKPRDTFRIIVLGDSFVEALQVALDNAFPALLEKRLNESSRSIRFEVLNLGHSGYGTADEYMRYLNFGVKYTPDLVLLAFMTSNDIRNNSKIINREDVAFYFVFDRDGNLVLDRSVIDDYERSLTLPKRTFQFIKQKSYLASFISERLYLFRYSLRQGHFHSLLARRSRDGNKLDEFSDLNIYLSNMSDRWKEAFAITEALLLKFRQAVEQHGTRFFLVTLTNAEQIHPDVQQQFNEEYRVAFDFEQPDRIIEEFARKQHITYLKLMPAFRDYHLRTGKYLHGFGSSHIGHWNESGHRLAAEKMLEFLKENHSVVFD